MIKKSLIKNLFNDFFSQDKMAFEDFIETLTLCDLNSTKQISSNGLSDFVQANAMRTNNTVVLESVIQELQAKNMDEDTQIYRQEFIDLLFTKLDEASIAIVGCVIYEFNMERFHRIKNAETLKGNNQNINVYNSVVNSQETEVTVRNNIINEINNTIEKEINNIMENKDKKTFTPLEKIEQTTNIIKSLAGTVPALGKIVEFLS